jgi:hypothetical protein
MTLSPCFIMRPGSIKTTLTVENTDWLLPTSNQIATYIVGLSQLTTYLLPKQHTYSQTA